MMIRRGLAGNTHTTCTMESDNDNPAQFDRCHYDAHTGPPKS